MSYISAIPPLDGMHVNATIYVKFSGLPQYTCDPSMPLNGVWSDHSWMTPTYAGVSGGYSEDPHVDPPYTIGKQKFMIDIGEERVITRFYYENGHSLGYDDSTVVGAKNAILYGSNSSSTLLDIDYDSVDNLNPLWSGILEQHSTYNGSDPKYVDLSNITPYRYYVFRIADNWGSDQIMCVRRIELQYFGQSSSSESSSYSTSSTEVRTSSSSSSTEIKTSSSSSSSSLNHHLDTSSSSTSSSSSYHCPNNIYSLVGADIYTSGIITSNVFLSVNANNSSDGSYYLELFDGDISGKTYDANRVFYGHEGSNTITSSNFVKIDIDSITYYLEVFGGDAQIDCCSNLRGDYYNTGSFQSAGYIMINVNGTLRFVQIYTKTA